MIWKAVSRGFAIMLVSMSISAHAETRYIEGDVIVTFKSTASLASAKATLKKRSMTFSKHFGMLSAKRKKQTGLVSNRSKTTAQLMAELKNDPDVETVEPNYLRWVNAKPDDPRFSELWALENTGQAVNGTTGTSGADIKFLDAWSHAKTSTGELVVAVIDTGVDYTHPDLHANMWVNDQEIPGNSTDDDNDGYTDDIYGYDFSASDADPWDSGHHGTHVSGTIAAISNNQAGITGLNDHVKIMALKVSNNGDTISTSSVIAAVQYATLMKNRGVNVVAINASYGGGGFSTTERDAIQAAGDAGIILCAAAGNETSNNDSVSTYPASYRLPNMIVVAATDQKDALASYSNYGVATVDLAAPGSNILSIKPSTMAFTAGGNNYTTNEITFTGRTAGVSGAIIDCGLGDTGDFPPAVNGNIALIQRGTLNFSVKVANAMTAGAKAAIIYNNVSGNFLGTLQTAGNWIPSLAITQADGQAIKAALPLNGSVTANGSYQFLNGTSMATPHVAGAVAFAAMCFTSETMSQRRARILAAVDVKPGLQGKTITAGRLNLMSVINGGNSSVQPWPYITTTENLLGAAAGEPYTNALTVTGGTAPYTFTLTQGTLPAGIVLGADGVLSGTPSAAGTSVFTILTSDASGPGASKQFTLVTAAAPLSITTVASLAAGTVGSSYSATLEASGGTAPYSWTVTSGSLPQGLSLTTAGVFGGLPTAAGSSTFTARIADAHGLTASRVFQVLIEESTITITSPAVLPGAVKSVAYNQPLAATGGASPYTWTIASGALPGGIQLSTSGVLIGTPTSTGTFAFVLEVTDDENKTSAQSASLTVTAGYQAPVINPVNLGSTTVGATYNATVSGYNYPKTFIISGLPKGLTYTAATGAISGRASVSGVFNVQIKASNTAGTGPTLTTPLVVKAIPTGMLGSFTGIITRNTGANGDLGSRLTLSTTMIGTFTAKVTTGVTTISTTGYLAATAPQISISLAGSTLTLNLDSQTSLLSGTHGTATVNGWRQTWNATSNPAAKRAGYYSIGMDLATPGDQGITSLPQGCGYATFTVASGGTLTLAGRTADGLSISSAGFMGPGGQIAVYQSLYGNKGSMAGSLILTQDPEESFLENTASGDLTWLKPKTTTRTYSAAFGPLNISAYGKYLAPAATGSIVLGLPATGSAALRFFDGGLALSATDPDVASFTYSSVNVVTMPAAGSSGNPARATLAINKASGAISGTCTLVDTNPALSRTFSFAGMIVRPATGTQKGVGWFLLPQIPLSGETIRTSPILSGKVVIEQP